MDAFKGEYTRTDAKNYEEFLKEMNVGFLLRKAATVSTPVMKISEEGGTWTITTSTTLKTMELKFKVINCLNVRNNDRSANNSLSSLRSL